MPGNFLLGVKKSCSAVSFLAFVGIAGAPVRGDVLECNGTNADAR